MTIGRRLTVGFGLVLGLLLLVVGVHLYVDQQESEATAYLTEQVMPRADAAHDLKTAYLRQSAGVRGYVLSGDEQWLVDYNEGKDLAAAAISNLERLPMMPEGAALFAEMRSLADRYNQTAERAIVLAGQGATAEATQLLREAEPTRDALVDRADAFVALQFRSRDQTQAELAQLQQDGLRGAFLISALALLAGALFAHFTARAVRQPVQALVEASDRVAEGDYEAAIATADRIAGDNAQGTGSEVRRLAARFRAMTRDLLLRERRLAAQSRLAAALASTIDVERIGGLALKELADYAQAEVGAVYACDRECDILERVASYCLPEGVPASVKLKDGLVGEAAAARRTLLVRDIPADLPFQVRLGVEDLPPRWVAAVPLLSHQELVGVVLLAGLRGPDAGALDFVEHGARQLAVSLQNGRAHQRIEFQNAQIHSQYEDLQAQSEEIQSQNEELQSQSEQIQSQNEELQSQNEELRLQTDELAERNRRLVEQGELIARLQGIALHLSESLSPEEVLALVVRAASDLTGSALASVLLLDESGEILTVAAAGGLDERQAASLELPREGSLAGQVLAEGRTAFLEDISNAPHVRFPQLAGLSLLGSIAVAPMIVHGQALGVVEVYYAESRPFSAADVDLLSALGAAAAVAVYNSRLFTTTEQHKQQLADALAERERISERLRLLLESTDEGIYGLDLEGRCTFINRAAAEMLGYQPEELHGKEIHELCHHSRPDGSPYPLEECPMHRTALEGVGRRVGDEVLWRRDGTSFPVEASSYPLLEDGTVKGAVATFTDVTARKRAEAERERLLAAEQEARAEAENAVRVRDEFISIAAHELKTPVTSLQGFAQLSLRELRQTGAVDPARLAKSMERIDQQSKRLTKLTEQLLDLSRLQSGRLTLSREETDLSALARAVVANLRQSHPGRTIELQTEALPPVFVDALRLEQVLINLVDNAFKFSPPEAGVEIAVGPVDGDWVQIAVRDHGIGIPAAERERVFERFYQAHPERHYGGMGIGLYISQQTVLMHGGAIAVEQPEDGGSRFVVRLPARRPESVPARGERDGE